ncbi:glutamine-hydrolyzing GMP synthase [Patescibacteria group bacterium]|nr:glutamine-hydrolyzing GMP synthase [Patescibacteria group bacterium]
MDKIAVLDFGGQYAHLIANRVRRLGVYSEILDPNTKADILKDYKGIIFSGGPQSVYDRDSLKADPAILDLGIPILGICYGHQLLAHMQGAQVKHEPESREYGIAEIEVKKSEGIFKGLKSKEIVWMSHGDTVMELPPGYEVIGSTKTGQWAALGNFKKNFFGTQFHLEVTHTKSGMKMLENFLDICGAAKEWSIDRFIENEIAAVKEKVGDKKVFMMVSGGVDSTVAFVLLDKALGPDRVYGLFVDTGLMRKNERQNVEKSLREAGFNNLHVKDAGDIFFEALQRIYNPEAKRKIIGDLFLRVQEKVVLELGLNPDEWLLGQGTIYPDTIESGGTKYAARIKTHHNRVQQIEELIKQGKVIEPLSQLYKDEVRQVGEKLGLSENLVQRHPFPGPGLGVRCLCAQEERYPRNYNLLQEKIDDELAPKKLEVFVLPIMSVGVQGDSRTYRNPMAILGDASFDDLGKIATDLINRFEEINRVVWTLYPQNIEEINIHRAFLTRERIALLQEADAIVDGFIHEKGLNRDIWQFPTVMVPLSVNRDFGESIILRPVESEEAMTANYYKMDEGLLCELTERLSKIDGITAVFYDVTNKPPGTIEWE